MRRIAITLTVLALVAGAFGCSSDAPTPPKPGPGPNPNGPSALQIRLFTSNPNPSAGTCTLIQAIVTLNGNNVPDGTGVVPCSSVLRQRVLRAGVRVWGWGARLQVLALTAPQ